MDNAAMKVVRDNGEIVAIEVNGQMLEFDGGSVEILESDIARMKPDDLPEGITFKLLSQSGPGSYEETRPPISVSKSSANLLEVSIEFAEHAAYWDGILCAHQYFRTLHAYAKKQRSFPVCELHDDDKFVHLILGTTVAADTVGEACDRVKAMFEEIERPITEIAEEAKRKLDALVA